MITDNGVVDCKVKLGELKQWRLIDGPEMPFYLHTGENGLVFNGKPETVRDLLRIFNKYKYNLVMGFVSFLNGEGVEAKKVSVSTDRMLGYPVELSLN